MLRTTLRVLAGLAVLVAFTVALERVDRGLCPGCPWHDLSGARLALLSHR